MLAYRLMVRFLRLVVGVFFRQVTVVGQELVPRSGPVIFAGNHPNSLIDPVLIVTTAGRTVHFAAKDVLFRSRLLRVFLRSLGCVPIFRRMDHTGQVDNSATFAALHKVLAQGGAMGIFPEGISHDESQLARLKTGAARIALGVLGGQPDAVVHIVPCGLTYVRRNRFRTRVLVQYGLPIRVDAERVGDNERESARTITDELEVGLRSLTVNADAWETLRVLDGVRRLYQPGEVSLEERVELTRRFSSVYPQVREHPEIVALYQQVAAYLERLDEAGLTDRDLVREIGPIEGGLRAALNLVRLVFWAPAAIPGLLIHLPLGMVARWAGVRFTPRPDVIATTKLVIGMGLVLLTYAALTTLAGFAGGWRSAALVAALLPVSGYATVRVLERGASIGRLLRYGWRAVRLRREIEVLRAHRAGLVEAAIETVNRHRPAEMKPLFARESMRTTASDLGH